MVWKILTNIRLHSLEVFFLNIQCTFCVKQQYREYSRTCFGSGQSHILKRKHCNTLTILECREKKDTLCCCLMPFGHQPPPSFVKLRAKHQCQSQNLAQSQFVIKRYRCVKMQTKLVFFPSFIKGRHLKLVFSQTLFDQTGCFFVH